MINLNGKNLNIVDQVKIAILCSEYYYNLNDQGKENLVVAKEWLINRNVKFNLRGKLGINDGYYFFMIVNCNYRENLYVELCIKHSLNPKACSKITYSFRYKSNFIEKTWNNFIND